MNGLRRHAPRTVDTCYQLFDKFFPACGLLDYTDAMYHGDPAVGYEEAQLAQSDYALIACSFGGYFPEPGHPAQLAAMLFCGLVSESWNRQFRGPNPPTRLLRQTWACCE